MQVYEGVTSVQFWSLVRLPPESVLLIATSKILQFLNTLRHG
jgi:hypothetical protein